MGIFEPVFEKRDLRLSDPKAWNPSLWNLYGSQSKTGLAINEESALRSSTVYRCNKIIADTLAGLPLKLYEKDSNGGRTELPDRRISRILRNPNSEMSHFRFVQTLQGHLFLWGNCFVGVNRDSLGRVLDLWPLRPDRVQITRDENGAIIYVLHTNSGQIPFTKREILHIPGYGFDGLRGYSIVSLARESIGLTLATEEYGARYFKNGHHPGIILSHPGKLSAKAKESMQQDFNEKYGGLGNVYRAVLLEEGLEVKTVGMPHDDAQFLETRKYQAIDFCKFSGVPPHMIFEMDRATWNNVEQQGIEWKTLGIKPWAVLWEQELSRYFLQPTEYGRIYFEFNLDGLERGDIKTRYESYGMAVDKGWLSRNEVRQLENMNPGPKELDEYTVQMQMVSIERAVAEPEPTPPQLEAPPEDEAQQDETQRSITYIANVKKDFQKRAAASRYQIQQSFRNLFKNAAQAIVNREAKAISRAITANFGERGKGDFDSWMNEFYKDMPEYIELKFRALFHTYAEQIQKEAAGEIGAEIGMTPELKKFIDEYMSRYSDRHIAQSILQLRRLMDREELENIAESLQTRIDEWSEKRADKIADNETVRLNNAVTRQIFFLGGITLISWVTMSGKPCPFCASLNGKVIGIDKPFVDKGYFEPRASGMAIKGAHFHPPLHQGCQCGISAEERAQEEKFVEAQTIEEAEEWARENILLKPKSGILPKSHIDYSGIKDIGVANRINKTLYELQGKYSSRFGAIRTVEIEADILGNQIAAQARTVMLENKSVSFLELNSNVFKNPESLKKFASESMGMFEDPSCRGIISHEYGHLLTHDAKMIKQIDKIYENWDQSHLASQYASVSSHEMAAEAFVVYEYAGSEQLEIMGLEDLAKTFGGLKQ